MAELKFQIPDARMNELVDAWGLGWVEEIDGEQNPQTKPQFAKEQIKQEIIHRIKAVQAQQAPDFPIT